MAMLALAPENKRSRSWLQDKLWSTRGKEQGAASLRQSLSEIRRALGSDRDCLLANAFVVSLDRSRIAIDLDDPAMQSTLDAGQDLDLLEGLDIGDQEFEDWLRLERQRIRKRHISVSTTVRAENAGAVRPAEPRRLPNHLLLTRKIRAGHGGSPILADSVLDTVAKSIAELGAATVFDRRTEPAETCICAEQSHTLALHSEIDDSNGKRIERLALLQLPDKSLIWSSTLPIPRNGTMDLNDPDLLRCANLAVSIATDQFVKMHADASERTLSSALCYSGMLHLFRLGKINFEAADHLFARAFEVEPRGIHLAWRAYLRTFLLAERQFTCRQTIDAEAFDFMRRALELEPHNSYVAALSAHVQTIMRRSYVAAYELAERSVQLNHANPIGWACLGVAKSHLGKPEEGFQHTLTARAIAGSAPYRYQLDALSCVVGAMAGQFDKAIYLAEASHALAPEFAPPLRYLSVLYSYAGRRDLSLEMVQKLQRAEPDFSYEKLRDKAYPVAGLRRTGIIDSLPLRQI
ncbi:hypothetical protein JQ625_09925 [Bradyrhizobium diazoefficiens]|nr:hypothetical protein [Bradyrhizobium diazoefficiens]MBR0775152.1 hypothetical protein [Bradyrhizobium diazoefficiens]